MDIKLIAECVATVTIIYFISIIVIATIRFAWNYFSDKRIPKTNAKQSGDIIAFTIAPLGAIVYSDAREISFSEKRFWTFTFSNTDTGEIEQITKLEVYRDFFVLIESF